MLDHPEQARRLSDFFLVRDPGDPPPDPAALGNPVDFDGEARHVVRRLQAGESPDAVYDDMSPQLKADMLAQGGQAAPPDPADALRTQLAQRWHVMGSGELLQPPKRPAYLLADMVRRPGLVCVYGAPGDLKSMLLMDLAVCVAGGQDWLDPLPNIGQGGAYQVTPGPILWLDMDNGAERLQERFGALCRGRDLDVLPLHAVSLPRPIYDASNPAEADLLAAQIGELGAVACFVDNLGTVAGGRDENSSQMVDVMANLRWVAQESGATLFVIHHARKGTGQAGGREGDRLRGHSSIEASLDLALLIERTEDDITVRSTKTRDDPVRPFVARWTFAKDADGALDTARFWHIENVRPKLPAHAQIAADLPDLLKSLPQPPNQSELVKELHQAFQVSRKTALQAIGYAKAHGLIREQTQAGAGATSPKAYYAA